jgi:hypothetical protein
MPKRISAYSLTLTMYITRPLLNAMSHAGRTKARRPFHVYVCSSVVSLKPRLGSVEKILLGLLVCHTFSYWAQCLCSHTLWPKTSSHNRFDHEKAKDWQPLGKASTAT